jgi:hypothetical protein
MGRQTTAYGSQKLITINEFCHRTRGFNWTFFRPVTFTSYLTINVPNIEHNLAVPSRYLTSKWPPSRGGSP